ncbi:MAG: MFS transporter [Jatrophihabitantaceae bacterium]
MPATPVTSAPAAVWLTAYAFTVTMLGTTLPTSLYPLYERRFDFGALTVTLVYAAYAVGVLAALLAFGRASDSLGRRPVLLAGLGFSAMSSTVFLLAAGAHSGGLPALFAGRVLSGLSAGIFTGTATAALADFAGRHRQRRASVIAAVANIGGLGLGPLVSGVLASYARWPLRTSYLLHLALLAGAVAAILAAPEPVPASGARRLRFQRLEVPSAVRPAFAQAATAGFAGFALLGLFTALSPSVLTLLGHSEPALTGLVVLAVFAASAGGQLASAVLPTRPALLAGTAILILGLGLLAASLAAGSLALLVVAGMIGGAGQGLSFRAALGLVTEISPARQRAGVASSFFAVVYIGISVPVVGVGAGAQAYGLVGTGQVFAGILAVLGLLALLSLARRGPAGT